MRALNLSTVNFNVNITIKEEFPYKEAIIMHFYIKGHHVSYICFLLMKRNIIYYYADLDMNIQSIINSYYFINERHLWRGVQKLLSNFLDRFLIFF